MKSFRRLIDFSAVPVFFNLF